MEEENSQNQFVLASRTPIVTVLGHVDHGKTTLLDKIRNSSVAQREAGGITQNIGASVVKTKNGKEITFIDTPGHAAFSSMRARGAKIADIAILVIACDDGIMPQTREAYEYIKSASIPFIIAATKKDLPSADVEMVKECCAKEGILLEGKGGDTPLVAVSGKSGEGIDDLLDLILLVSEVHGTKASDHSPLESFVFETGKDKRGLFASLVVKNGKITVGDTLVSENCELKVRALFDYQGESVGEILPGYPCQLIGFSTLPQIGSNLWKKDESKTQIQIKQSENIQIKLKDDEIPVVVKAQSAGSLEALIANLPAKVVVLGSGVGEVIEADVFLAKSVNADIYAFESKIGSGVAKLAETEGVKIYQFDIIYKLFEHLEKELKKDDKEELGKAEIIGIFPFNNKKVAGCKVLQGKIGKNASIIIRRLEKEIGSAKIISLKKSRQDINEAKQGEEFGAIFAPQLDIAIGDMVYSLQ